MKVSWFFWWLITGFWIVAFVIGSYFLAQREVDGAGAVQTPEIILLNILVFASIFILPLLIQIGWLIVMIVLKKKKKDADVQT
ncbi:DUF3923 family protein [Geomicrobium sp. JCM 19038]|uniref:DUF3923 family protein n=1 Tax=Geomicrobium sp. JCM 19038 TaxID=1460635 RepID=UPI00045F422E|nr:DUF3923 family protein [Geomicrobium sp. JCM 19038]EZH65297.1 membrane protein [Bacillaceae bacterium JMAK1]GAK09498.1 hypothetical protein JCM19038_3337 [Geomicrobium sp. JCM 19038]